MAKNDIYQIKVTLKASKPPIWRRIEVPGEVRLNHLHLILQAAMGWLDYHLHHFIVGQTYYGEPDPDDMWDIEILDESNYRLNQLAPTEKSKIIYVYDFGDNWEHILLVEKIIPAEKGVVYPRCIKGKGACPPEDVGGVWGYAEFLQVIRDPNHPEYEDMREWAGEDFDPTAFDLDEINDELEEYRLI
jgi:hypothetical protein